MGRIVDWNVSINSYKNHRAFVLSFLILLIVLHHHVQLSSSKAVQQAGLYGPEDKVVILDHSNIKQHIYHSNKTWLVEFYSSWCGHCIQFAPLYKSFANELWGWRSVLSLAVIDCADESNIGQCRNYEIMGYPSFLIFGPYSVPSLGKDKDGMVILNRGEPFKRPEMMSHMKKDLIDKLTPLYSKLLSPITSNISINDFDIHNQQSQIWSENLQVNFILVIFEGDSSYVGNEVTLSLSGYSKIRVMRFTRQVQLYNDLELSGWPSCGYLKKDGTTGKIGLENSGNLIDLIVRSTMELAKINPEVDFIENNIVAPMPIKNKNKKDQDQDGNENVGHEGEAQLVHKPQVDKVYMEDLIHAIRNSLKNEVLMTKRILGEKLDALKSYLEVLIEFFPADRRELKIFLTRLNEWIKPQFEIKSSQLSEQILMLEEELNPFDVEKSTWIGCKGSTNAKRGYPCGLWRLFHSLTIVAYERQKEDSNVIQAVYLFVKEFFGCRDCAEHFMGMVHKDNALEAKSIKDQVIWLWKTHNKVNLRTKGTLSEDPQYPKSLYPLKTHCPECYKDKNTIDNDVESDIFDEDKVLEYLQQIYSRPIRDRPSHHDKVFSLEPLFHNDSRNQLDDKGFTGFFSNLDIGILLIVYISIALLLIFGYVHFRTRRIDPTTYILHRMCSKSIV